MWTIKFFSIPVPNADDEVLEKVELERQNNITQRIFANYLERKLFPHRKPQHKIPTIDEILPKTTNRPRRFSKPKKNTTIEKDEDGDRDEKGDDDIEEADEIDETDEEALQTVESEQHDLYDFDEDPRENDVLSGECFFF